LVSFSYLLWGHVLLLQPAADRPSLERNARTSLLR